MSLTGIILDVSGCMRENIGSGIDEQGGPWVESIFKVIDDIIEHDLTSENRVFAIGVGANCTERQIFDVIGTVQQIGNMKMPDYQKNDMPATKDHIKEILDILERNGARNIRKWVHDVNLIQDTISDHMAALILAKLETDEQFLSKFVHEFLPSAFRDTVPTVSYDSSQGFNPLQFVLFLLGKPLNVVENVAVGAASTLRPDTKEEMEEIVDKTKCYFLKDVGTHSIFSVENASRIFYRCVERKQELYENVEPFIYGCTPLYESLEKATKLFERDTSDRKLLFVLSSGQPTDGSNEDSDKISKITSKLRRAGVKVVSCFITKSTDIHPKRLFDEMHPGWETGAKFLFSLSSEVPTQHLPRAILFKRGWTIDIANNETKLFIQVNHPDNLREASKMAQDVACSSDALSELLASVDLDIYISQSTSGFEAKRQQGGTSYANASAAVLHLATQRILGREGGYPDFHKLKEDMIETYGIHGADTSKVLQEICPKYRLHSQKVDIKGAKEAIVQKCPVIGRFRLTDDEWKAFSNFYKNNPRGILTQNELDICMRPTSPPPDTFGHAVVLTSYNSKCLTFMNSWGQEWADKGFFRVQNAKVLQLEFFDVYWELNDLTEGEKEYYRKHGSKVAAKLMKSLKGLQNAEYTCPECKQTSLVTEFEGTLSNVRCPKCPTGNILALNMHLTSGNPKLWKWEKRSIRHEEKLMKLFKHGQDHPEQVKEVGGVRVCCSRDFLIGKGGEGTRVYIGLGKDGYERAVKRLPRDACASLAEQEKKVLNDLRAIKSNHVINYCSYDDESDDDHLYLILDLCEETLEEFVGRSSLDDLKKFVPDITRQVLEGFADLHGDPMPTLHRDVKPSNILRNVHGKWLLADFGLARILMGSVTTHASKQRGTVHWRAVETYPSESMSVESNVRYKKESDIQVAGMVVFFIVTKGGHPYGEEAYRLLNLHQGKPVGLDLLKDPILKDLLSWMLSHDPKDRPSAEEALKHPYLQPVEQQYKLLCRMGNQREVKTPDLNSPVVQSLNNDPVDWKTLMPADVLQYLCTDFVNGKTITFSYNSTWTDCLRLIRNVNEHWYDRPRPKPQPAAFYLVGDPQEYFLNVFPNLPVVVHKIVRSCDWKERRELREYFM